MNTNKKIKLIGAIMGVILFIVLMAGISYAWFTWQSSNINISGLSECFTIGYTKGKTLENEPVILFDESTIINNGKVTIKNGMALTNVTAYLDSTCNIYANITLKLNVTSLNSAFISGNSVGAFKYIIASYDPSTYSDITTTALNGVEFDIIKNASITNTGEITLLTEQLTNTEKGYMLIFYVDGDLAMNDAENSMFTATITGTATQTEPPTLIEHITNLYTSGNSTLITQGTSGDTYYYSYQDTNKTWGLMNDGLKVDTTQDETTTGLAATVTDTTSLTNGTEGNIRYFGPSDSVNNYIYFNCETYPDTNCELWRIIGIVDGKVKIIRNKSIGDLAWDQDKNQDSSLTTYSNNWEASSLQLMLNSSYYNGDTAGTITYLSGGSGEITTTLDMNSIGIKNATTRNMISESIWYLGGYSTTSLYSNDIYTYERTNTVGTTIYSGNPFTITSNIGLMYASDYGYATDLSKCSSQLDTYNSSTDSYACGANNWLFNSRIQWLITPFSSSANLAWNVSPDGDVYYGSHVEDCTEGSPVLYLNSELGIESEGEGTSTSPYRISVS